MSKLSARARVTMMVEIIVKDRWGLECDMKQIRSQAYESAIQELHNGASVAHNGRYGTRSAYCLFGKGNWALIGEPKVEAVIIEDAKEDVHVQQRGPADPVDPTPVLESPPYLAMKKERDELLHTNVGLKNEIAQARAVADTAIDATHVELLREQQAHASTKNDRDALAEAVNRLSQEVVELKAAKTAEDVYTFLQANPMTGDDVYKRIMAVLKAFVDPKPC